MHRPKKKSVKLKKLKTGVKPKSIGAKPEGNEMALKYVLTENGNVKIKDGMPLVVDDETEAPEEMILDGIGLYNKVPALQNEAKTHRLKLKDTKEALKKYEDLGIEDVESFPDWKKKAQKALETTKNLDESKLIEAGKVEEIKASVKAEADEAYKKFEKQSKERVAELEKAINQKDTTVRSLMVDDRFNTSAYISNDLVITPKMARKIFGENFKVEQGENGKAKTIGYIDGEPIMSRTKMGDYAPFDEALQTMIDSDADADAYKRANPKKTPENNTNTFQTKPTDTNTMSSVDKIKAGLAARKKT